MKATLRILSALMLCALAPMVITGCKPADDTTTTSTNADDGIEWNLPEAALDTSPASVEKATKIVAAVDGWIAYFNAHAGFAKPADFADKTFNFTLKVLTQKEEMNGEAKDLFDYSWAKNQVTLAKLADQVGVPAFKEKEGFVMVSIGSSSTQGYYVYNGKAKGFGYLFGTGALGDKAKEGEKDAAIDDLDVMMKGLKALGRPVVFTNSVSFAEYPGYVPPTKGSAEERNEFVPMRVPYDGGQKFDETYPKGRDKVGDKPNTASMMANIIAEKVTALGMKDVFILKASKLSKLANKWTRSFIRELPGFKNRFAWMGDLGGGGYSIKLVANNDFVDEEDNLIWKDAPDKAAKTDEYDQEPVLTALDTDIDNFKDQYENDGNAYGKMLGQLYAAITKSLEDNKAKPGFKDQPSYEIWMGQTGKVRALYYKSKAIIEEAARKAGATSFFFNPMKNEKFAANRNISLLAA